FGPLGNILWRRGKREPPRPGAVRGQQSKKGNRGATGARKGPAFAETSAWQGQPPLPAFAKAPAWQAANRSLMHRKRLMMRASNCYLIFDRMPSISALRKARMVSVLTFPNELTFQPKPVMSPPPA